MHVGVINIFMRAQEQHWLALSQLHVKSFTRLDPPLASTSPHKQLPAIKSAFLRDAVHNLFTQHSPNAHANASDDYRLRKSYLASTPQQTSVSKFTSSVSKLTASVSKFTASVSKLTASPLLGKSNSLVEGRLRLANKCENSKGWEMMETRMEARMRESVCVRKHKHLLELYGEELSQERLWKAKQGRLAVIKVKNYAKVFPDMALP